MPIVSRPPTTWRVFTNDRTAYCGCRRVPQDRVCATCLQCPEHCQCVVCSHCLSAVYANEICNKCQRCVGCCTCFVCPKCYGKHPKEKKCSNCGRCEGCCKCYHCDDCGRRLETGDPLRATYCFGCLHCENHCTCHECPHEGSYHRGPLKNKCHNCGFCKTHCTCVPCPMCGNRIPREILHTTAPVGSVDIPCGHCRSCCVCSSQGVPLWPGRFKLFNGVFRNGDYKQNGNRRHISVEIEVDRFDAYVRKAALNATLRKWGDPVVRDGSIPGGFEINSNPCNGDVFLTHMKELADGLAGVNASCSTACGMHVHVNTKGSPLYDANNQPIVNQDGMQLFDPRDAYTFYDLRRLILLYYIIEPAVFGLCAPHRLNGNYSLICGKYYLTKNVAPKEFRKDVITKMYLPEIGVPKPQKKGMNGKVLEAAKKLKTSKSTKYMGIRYKALNLHSFFLRGTVEFRHKEGTVDFHEITNWSLICATIVDKAAKMTEKEIRTLPINDPRTALLTILPDNLRQYAERKFASYDETQPRFKEQIRQAWASPREDF